MSTDNRSLRTRLEELLTVGHGSPLQPQQPALNGAFTNAPHVVTESEIKINNSTMYSPLSTPPLDLHHGTATSAAYTSGALAGQSYAQTVMVEKQKQNGQSEQNKGVKHDQNKPPLAYIPKAALDAEGMAFAHGAKKYDAWNYKNGLAVTRTISAALRHISQFLEGEDTDVDSGAHHLGCARAGLAMALDTLANHPELDDRYKKENK